MITFDVVKAYLDAIAANANNDITNSPHKMFWTGMTENDFLTKEVPNITKNGVVYHIKIVDLQNPAQSPILKILLGTLTVTQGGSSATFRQMPDGGPFITDRNPMYNVNVAGVGSTDGDKIEADLREWLQSKAAPPPVAQGKC